MGYRDEAELIRPESQSMMMYDRDDLLESRDLLQLYGEFFFFFDFFSAPLFSAVYTRRTLSALIFFGEVNYDSHSADLFPREQQRGNFLFLQCLYDESENVETSLLLIRTGGKWEWNCMHTISLFLATCNIAAMHSSTVVFPSFKLGGSSARRTIVLAVGSDVLSARRCRNNLKNAWKREKNAKRYFFCFLFTIDIRFSSIAE